MVFDRDPITGPLGVLLCGGGGAEVVGFGADVGCGWVGAGFLDRDEVAEVADEEACESLMDPPLGRSSDVVPPGSIAAPLGRSASPEASAPVVETTALFVSGAGWWPAALPQATQTAQTRAAATAVAAALAGATVPRIGMDATVAKRTAMREDSYACTRCAARLLHRIRSGRLFA